MSHIREEFIEILEKRGYPYSLQGNKIIITGSKDFTIGIDGIPPGVVFNNSGVVDIPIDHVSDDVEFNNGGYVNLSYVISIGKNVKFKNNGNVFLGKHLNRINSSVEFNNSGAIYTFIISGMKLGDILDDFSYDIQVDDWQGNIEGVDSTRLMNLMISKGLFDSYA